MKFRQRILVCGFLLLVIIPFIYLRFRLGEEKHPLISSKTNDRFLHDGKESNDVKQHLVQRSSERGEGTKSRPEQDGNEEPILDQRRENGGKLDSTDDSLDYEFDDPWRLWKEMVKARQLSSPDDPDSINMILEGLTYKPIVAVGVGYKGTQLKATMMLEGKQRVVFKPKR